MNTIPDCNFCHSFVFQTHVTAALQDKYSSGINYNYAHRINEFIMDEPSPANVQYRESLYQSDECEYLKRQYRTEEFSAKIGQLSEYYKFNRNLPQCFEVGVAPIIYKYYDLLKGMDFRKVKAVLKQQQGISLTTQHNESSFMYTDEELKSRYSNVLQELDSRNQSNMLNSICEKIGNAYGEGKLQPSFRGFFPDGRRKFDDFMVKEAAKKQRNYNKAIKTRNRETNYGIGNPFRDIQFINKENVFKNEPDFFKIKDKKKSIERTVGNDTNYRDQKPKKSERKEYRQFLTEVNAKSKEIISKKQSHFEKEMLNYEKYQSIKSKKHSKELVRSKSKLVLRPSSKSNKILTCSKEFKEGRYVIETDRMNRDESKVSARKSSSSKLNTECRSRQPSMQSQKVIPVSKLRFSREPSARKSSKEKERTLSKSKSRVSLSKQNSINSIQAKPKSSRSTSNFQQANIQQTKVQLCLSKQSQRGSNIDRLLNKKLALFPVF